MNLQIYSNKGVVYQQEPQVNICSFVFNTIYSFFLLDGTFILFSAVCSQRGKEFFTARIYLLPPLDKL